MKNSGLENSHAQPGPDSGPSRRLHAVIESWSTLPEHIREQVYLICKDNAAVEQMRLRTLTLPYTTTDQTPAERQAIS